MGTYNLSIRIIWLVVVVVTVLINRDRFLFGSYNYFVLLIIVGKYNQLISKIENVASPTILRQRYSVAL